MKRLTFLFSIMVMLLVSGLITSPAGAATINVLGSWATGTTHAKETGTDRALIFIAHAESTSTINLSAVSYGGQAMTKVVDYSYNAASGYAYAAAFILKETGVAAASSSTFTVTWGGTAPGSAGYSSVFLSNVNQTTATGATGSRGSTTNPVTTSSSLATASGDMVILGATCGNAGSYTLNNSFIEGTDQQIGGTVTGVTGRKSATGAAETPSATYSSTINRQMIIGLVVKATGGTTPTLSVSPTSLTVAAASGSTGTFNITSNVSWTVSSNQTWLTVSPASGSNNGTVTVTAQQNTGSARTATVTVSGTGVSSQTVTVTQSGAGNTLSVSPTSLSVAAAAGSTGTFNITSNVSWTVSSNQTWLTASPTSGSNNGTVTVTATSANTGGARTATVTVSGTGVTSQTVTVTQSGTGGGGGDENCDFSGCTIPAMPSYASLPTNAYLPDPFTFMNGTRMTTKAEWDCRRAEIATEAQEFELGYKPCTAYSATTGSKSGNSIVVNVTDNGHTMSFTCSITYPSTGTAPYPALIACGGSSLSSVSSLGVAVINLPNDTIAQQNNSSSRGVGSFYNMYGSGHSAGAMMAWAWAASRLIDAIEKTPSCNIDPTRIGVTGCSRNGKGALVIGAFDERIKLTIPQESGSGGSASWRVSDYMYNNGQNTQTLHEITGENVWFRANFNQFNNTATKLPFDHHEIIGLVAPRAILLIDNDILWLGTESSWNCANAAKMIWTALGVPDKFGYSGSTAHTHCSFPSSQQTELTAYIQKYLVGGGTGTTGIMRNGSGKNYDPARWINWTVPSLQ